MTSPRPQGTTMLLVLLVLQLGAVVLLPFTSGWSAELIYLAMAVIMVLSLRPAKQVEDADPEYFVKLVFGASIVMAVALSLPWLPISRPGYAPTVLRLSYPISVAPTFQYDRVLTAAGFLLLSWSIFSILRTLERRPSLGLLLVLNPVTLLLLGVGAPWLVSYGVLLAGVSLLIKEKYPWAFALLGLSLGVSLIGVACTALFVKFAFGRLTKESRLRTLAISLGLYAVFAFGVGYLATGGYFAESFTAVAFWGEKWSIVSLVLAAPLLAVLVWRVQVSGKDNLIYAMLLAATLFAIVTGSIEASGLVLLVVLGAPFRSTPQLWIAFIAGVATVYPSLPSTLLWAVGAVVFAILLVLQLRHAYRETGIFQTIELREGELG